LPRDAVEAAGREALQRTVGPAVREVPRLSGAGVERVQRSDSAGHLPRDCRVGDVRRLMAVADGRRELQRLLGVRTDGSVTEEALRLPVRRAGRVRPADEQEDSDESNRPADESVTSSL